MPDDPHILGLHHVTAITADAQANLDFYTGTLGLKLVKLTVNFDDPSSYHLYYGDATGAPGTLITFFAWPGAFEGRKGPPQATATAFAAPRGSVDHWRKQLASAATPAGMRFGHEVLDLSDPDGMRLEVIFCLDSPGHALEKFHSVTLSEEGYEHTARVLTDLLGFRQTAEHGNRFRFEVAAGGPGAIIDVLCLPDSRQGSMGAGTIHHVAWRTPDEIQQFNWRTKITSAGHNVSPVMDRTYFHSIYFREPGGVLFEIATDGPGMAADEPPDSIGKKLMLPPWLEPARSQVEAILPRLRLPSQ